MRTLTVVGLVYDGAGVILLARAFALISERRLYLLSQILGGSQYDGGNPAQFQALRLQRLDAQVGLALVLAGFLLQILGALGVAVTDALGWMLGLCLLPGYAAYEWVRFRVKQSSIDRYRQLTYDAIKRK